MKKIYVLLLLFTFVLGFAQNTEIKDAAGVVLPTPYYFCVGSNLNLQVDDYASAAGSSSGFTTFSDFSLYTASTIGETEVSFSVDPLTRDKFSYPIDLGFNFTFFNKTYTRLVVGSNGRLVFSNDPILNNLHDTSTFIDRPFLSPPVRIASPKYNQIYKTGDITREINMAQIFAGFTNLRINAATGKYIFKRFDIAGNKGILIKFQTVIAHDNFGVDYGPAFTSQVIIFEDGRVVLNVSGKNSASRAILGMQNEEGDLAIVPTHGGGSNYNNDMWASENPKAFVITTGSVRTPTYLWELDRDNDGTVDETSDTRSFPNYSPASDIEKLSVKISFLETPEIKTSSIEFRKVRIPIIEKNVSGCNIILKVNSATFDAGLTYHWFRYGVSTVIPTPTNGQLVLNSTAVSGEYYAVAVKPDGTSCATISNKIEIKKFFPTLIKSQLTVCDNSSTPAAATTVNLYSEFYPQHSGSSAFEEYEVDFFDSSGSIISDPMNYSVPRNQDISVTVRRKLKLQPTYCESDIIKINFIAIPSMVSIPVCSSVTIYDLKNYFNTNFPASSHTYNFTYSDGSSAGDGSSVDVTRNVLVSATVAGSLCSANTQVTFTPGSSISIPPVPIQERCQGNSTNNADRFDFNFIKSILDPSGSYDVKFYRKSDDSEIIASSGTGENLNSEGYFWSSTLGDYIIYAKVTSRTDPTCFAVSANIILRVYIRPTAKINYQDFMRKNACGVAHVNLTISDIFEIINPIGHSQIPTWNYFDESGNELSGVNITNYDIARGTPYLLIQNGNCLPPLRLNYTIISAPFPIANPLPETLCDDLDGNPDGKVKIQIASNLFKSKFTADYSTATFKFYDGAVLLHTSNTLNDAFEYEVTPGKTISVKVSSSEFCENESSITFNINLSTVLLVSVNTDLCYNVDLNIAIQNYADFSSIKMIDPDNVETIIFQNLTVSYLDVQFGKTYKLQAQNSEGCISEFSFTPSDQNQPKIEVINQTNNSIEVIVNGGVQPLTYYFNGVAQASNILLNPTEPYYEIQVQSGNGCLGPPKTIYFIKINNAFTPNGDGINDIWRIENLDKMQSVSLIITDRGGTKVFESQNKTNMEWDGKSNGRALPSSTYWYTLTWFDAVTQKTEQRQGWILLKNRN